MSYPVVLKIAGPADPSQDRGERRATQRSRRGMRARSISTAWLPTCPLQARRGCRDLGRPRAEDAAGGQGDHPGHDLDPRFGPLLMFGLGGIYAEALRMCHSGSPRSAKTSRSEMIHVIPVAQASRRRARRSRPRTSPPSPTHSSPVSDGDHPSADQGARYQSADRLSAAGRAPLSPTHESFCINPSPQGWPL